MRTLTLLLTAAALAVSMGIAHAEENSTGVAPKVREVHPLMAADKATKNLKVHSAAKARTPAEKSMSRKSSPSGGGESAVAKAWRDADI